MGKLQIKVFDLFLEFWNSNCAQVDYGNQRCGKFDQVVQYMCQHRGNVGTIWHGQDLALLHTHTHTPV